MPFPLQHGVRSRRQFGNRCFTGIIVTANEVIASGAIPFDGRNGKPGGIKRTEIELCWHFLAYLRLRDEARQTLKRGSRKSRSESPNRLNANTARLIARPGKITIHGASR